MKNFISIVLLMVAGLMTAYSQDMQVPENHLDAVCLEGDGGKWTVNSDGEIIIQSPSGTIYTVYDTRPVSGNFYVETEFEKDDAVGLVLFRNDDGRPDLDNYTMIAITRRDGVVFANHYDRQFGAKDVHDPITPSRIKPSRYETRLDGSVYSVPFTGTNKKLRILHESLSNTFHFYYGTRLDKFGYVSEDWMELAPLYSWLMPQEEYLVGVLCRNETSDQSRTAVYKTIIKESLPEDDIDDSHTGFKVTDRNYSWSGFSGKATVVTFGDDFDYDRNIKLVFWDRNNNAPMWRLNNQFQLNFEFYESGDSRFQGCHEAMSDRHRHGQSVTILEDNDVRKVIRWHGIALNPDYNHSGEEAGGEQKPTYDEYWTIYPDGTAIRKLIDKPKVDVPGRRRSWGPEFIELMPIGGSLVEAGDLCASPALTLMDMGDKEHDYHPPHSDTFRPDTWSWDQIIFNAHFKSGLPDFYIVYSQDEEFPDTWCGLKLQGQLNWQSPDHIFSHWPVGREPYGQNVSRGLVASQSHGSYKNEVTHTSLVSAGFYEKGTEFEGNYKIDPENGRPYRSHVMLVGIADAFDHDDIRNETATWLFKGKVKVNSKGFRFNRNNYQERLLEFESLSDKRVLSFTVGPDKRPMVNPAIEVLSWKGPAEVKVEVNSEPVVSRSAVVDGNLLVWIDASIDKESRIVIQ